MSIFSVESTRAALEAQQWQECVRLWSLRIVPLLFRDDVVLLASLVDNLQHTLERFVAECEDEWLQ